jgi:hypothetical protein
MALGRERRHWPPACRRRVIPLIGFAIIGSGVPSLAATAPQPSNPSSKPPSTEGWVLKTQGPDCSGDSGELAESSICQWTYMPIGQGSARDPVVWFQGYVLPKTGACLKRVRLYVQALGPRVLSTSRVRSHGETTVTTIPIHGALQDARLTQRYQSVGGDVWSRSSKNRAHALWIGSTTRAVKLAAGVQLHHESAEALYGSLIVHAFGYVTSPSCRTPRTR